MADRQESSYYNVPKRQMSGWIGILIAVTIFLLLLGTGFVLGGVGGAVIGGAIYIAWGLIIPSKQEFYVVERLGRFYVIYHDGPHILCLRGLIDIVAARGTIQFQELMLYQDEVAAEIDFTDASAPISASAWFCIGQPEPKQGESQEEWWQQINADILRWTYAFRDPRGRIEELIDGYARPRLQKMTTDEAQVKSDTLSGQVSKNGKLTESMREFGAYLEPTKAFILHDVALPQDIKDLRKKRLEGETQAQKIKNTARGYWQSIKEIKIELNVEEDEARAIFETQRGFETIEAAKTNISFVSPNIGGVVKTVGVADTTPRRED